MGNCMSSSSLSSPAAPATEEAAATVKPTATTGPVVSVSSVLASAIQAKTLTISDQHANILLTTTTKQQQDQQQQRALLKITLVPFHKTALACLPQQPEEEGGGHQPDMTNPTSGGGEKEERNRREEQEHSTKVLKFLSQWNYRMTSESGAEYSFYEAIPNNNNNNNKMTEKATSDNNAKEPDAKRTKKTLEGSCAAPEENTMNIPNTFKVELIYPASEKQVLRAMPVPGMKMIYETPEMYNAVTKPYINGIIESGSLSWLKNIVEIKKEKERLLHNGEGWILNIDTKWRTHPDALTVPRSQWYKHESVSDLYCLGIIKADNVATVRDLNAEQHLPVLRDMYETGPKVIEQIYGIKRDQLRVSVHYQPQFYHFHVHYTRLENEVGAQVERAHLLLDIIQDLEMDSTCFQKKTITYKIGIKNELYKLLTEYEEEAK